MREAVSLQHVRVKRAHGSAMMKKSPALGRVLARLVKRSLNECFADC